VKKILKHRWVFVAGVLLATVFASLLAPAQTVYADYGDDVAGCTYTMAADKQTIKRTNCNGKSTLTFDIEGPADGIGKFVNISNEKSCKLTIETDDTGSAGTLSGQYEKEQTVTTGGRSGAASQTITRCEGFDSVNVTIAKSARVSDTNKANVVAARISLVNDKLEDIVADVCKGDSSGRCTDNYTSAIGTCTTKAYSQANSASGSKNNKFRDSLLNCLKKETDGGLNSRQDRVRNALKGNIMGDIDEAAEKAAAQNALGVADESDPDVDNCSASGNPTSWIICPIYEGLAGISDWVLDNVLEGFLETSPVSTDPDDPIYQVWSAFRVWGNVLLVIGLLVVVFGQAIGGGLVDAYTAKKVLPRLLVAAILINLSIYIVALAVDISNILGQGIANIMTAPLDGLDMSPGGVWLGVVAAASIGVGAYAAGGWAITTIMAVVATPAAGLTSAFGPYLLLFVILPILMSLLFIFTILLLRKAIILALILVSPVAFALYCLPNTEQWFRKWWSLLFNMLLLYPIIMVIFATANILAYTSVMASGESSVTGWVVALMLQFLPLFLIPYAFKLAGGVLGRIHDLATGYGKKGLDGLKGDPRDPNSWHSRAKNRARGAMTSGQIRLQDAADKEGASRRTRLGSKAANFAWWGATERQSQYMEESMKRMEAMSSTGRDDERYAAAGWRLKKGEAVTSSTLKDSAGNKIAAGTTFDRDMFFDAKGRTISENLYKRSKANSGASITDLAQNLEYGVRKIQTDDDIANFRTAFGKVAQERGWNEAEMMDQWAAATYPHKKILGSQWFSKPKAGPNGSVVFGDVTDDDAAGHKAYGGAIGEIHKVKKQFELSDRRDNDVRDDAHVLKRTEDKLSANPSNVTDTELTNLAMLDDVMQTMSSRGLVTRDGEGEITVSGGSAISNRIMKNMFKEQRYSSAEVIGADGRSSVNERFIYDKAAVEADRRAHDERNANALKAHRAAVETAKRAGTAIPPEPVLAAFNTQASMDHHAVRDSAGEKRIVKVTGDIDRPDVPTQIP
jgi:hypothetical protein